MSCQQVPRLTEDPYTFTEPPVSSTFIRTQVQKLTPIKPLNKIQIPAIKRVNGCTPHVNGLNNAHIPIYAKSQSRYQQQSVKQHNQTKKQNIHKQLIHQQQQQQQQQQPVKLQLQDINRTVTNIQSSALQNHLSNNKVTTITTTKRYLLPPPAATTTVINKVTCQSLSNNNPPLLPLQPNLPPPPPPPPPLYQQQIRTIATCDQRQQQVSNHSIVTSNSVLVQPKLATIQQQRTCIKQQQSRVPADSFNTSPGSVELLAKNNNGGGGKNDKSSLSNDSCGIIGSIISNCSVANSATSPVSNGIIGSGRLYNKPVSRNSSNTFVRPKVEAKAFIAGKKSAAATISSSPSSSSCSSSTSFTSISSASSGSKSQMTARTKRSYSQSSHHEALQRISLSSKLNNSNTTTPCSSIKKTNTEWHAPDSYIFDYAGPCTGPQYADTNFDFPFATSMMMSVASATATTTPTIATTTAATIQQHIWFKSYSFLSRDQRLEYKKNYLRRQAYQYSQAQSFRHIGTAKRRLIGVCRALKKLNENNTPPTPKKCGIPSCSNEALALTAYCYLHITLNTDQKLFHPCTAKFSDNSQCRVPVFDISHELPLCREHAWKRDNYNRMLQEQKPKKPPRKKSKPSAMTRPPKRNKKKKKPPLKQQQQQHVITSVDGFSYGTTILSTKENRGNVIITANNKTATIINNSQSEIFSSTQEMFGICENSSAYESSEDTGVGGLSESELINATDEIPLGDARLLEEHDLTNVLNQLPEDAFNELFTVQQNDPYEPTQEEQEDLERALEAVDEQVKSLEKMTSSTNFLGDFLDVDDEILDDSNMCPEVLHSPEHAVDIRGLVHT